MADSSSLSTAPVQDTADTASLTGSIRHAAGSPPSETAKSQPADVVSPQDDSSSTDAAKETTAANPLEVPQYVSGLRLVMLTSSVTLAVFLMMIDTSIISTAIPRITDEFRSLSDVGWYASIYQLASAAFQPLSGKIYAKFSTKFTFLVFFAIFELGSLICGAATSSAMLIVGRAVAGMGCSGLMNGGLVIIATAVPLERRPSLTGIMMGCSQLGIVIGPLIGGAFTSYSTWRWCFYVNLPIGAVVAFGMLLVPISDQFAMPRPLDVLRRLHLELDLVGFALIAPAAVQLMLALQWGGSQYPWNSATVIGLFCGAAGTTLVWGVWNWYRGDEALIPLSLIRQRALWAAALTQWFLLTTVYAASFFLPIYFQAVFGATPIMSGVYVLASILSQLVAAVVSGVLVERTGYVIPYAMVGGALGAISNGLYSTFTPTTPTERWVGYQILNGIGRGVGMQMPILAVQVAVKPHLLSIGMSTVVFIQSLGVAIMLSASDTVFQTILEDELPIQAPFADAAAIISAGATHFRNIVSERDLPGVLVAYTLAVDHVFYLAAAVTGLAVFSAMFLGWTDLRKVKKVTPIDAEQPREKPLNSQDEAGTAGEPKSVD